MVSRHAYVCVCTISFVKCTCAERARRYKIIKEKQKTKTGNKERINRKNIMKNVKCQTIDFDANNLNTKK